MSKRENLDRQIEVLGSLISACDSKYFQFDSLPGWVKPRMLGAWDASYHSGVLKTLCKKGLAEKHKMHSMAQIRHYFVYKPTEAGKIFYEMAKQAKSAKCVQATVETMEGGG